MKTVNHPLVCDGGRTKAKCLLYLEYAPSVTKQRNVVVFVHNGVPYVYVMPPYNHTDFAKIEDIDKAYREYVQYMHNRCTPCDSIEEAFEKAINEFRALINKKEK